MDLSGRANAAYLPIPHSGSRFWEESALRKSLGAEDSPRHTHPQPYPPENMARSVNARCPSEMSSDATGGTSMGDHEFEPGHASLVHSKRDKFPAYTHGGMRERKSRNYGSSSRIHALLAMPPAAGVGTARHECLPASSSVLSRPSLNSTITRQQRIWDAASSRMPEEEVEKRMQQELKRIEASGRAQVEQGRIDTVEASLALEESRIRDGLGTDEMFRGLVPITTDVKQVLKAKIVGKQIDPKWKSMLALKPSIDLFDDEEPNREVREFFLPALPTSLGVPSLSGSCGPTLVASYTRHLDFDFEDLRELPDDMLDVDRLSVL
jgi:hypothetical protein